MFDALRKLLGLDGGAGAGRKAAQGMQSGLQPQQMLGGAMQGAMQGAMPRQQEGPQPIRQYAQYMNADGTGGGFGPNNPSLQQRPTEDSGLVDTPQGRMPLSSVTQGQLWQNPDNGYSPNGYNQRQQMPNFEEILKNLRSRF